MKQPRLKSCLLSGALCLAVSAGAQSNVIRIGINQPLTGAVAVAAAGDFVPNGANPERVIGGNQRNATETLKVAEKLIDHGKIALAR